MHPSNENPSTPPSHPLPLPYAAAPVRPHAPAYPLPAPARAVDPRARTAAIALLASALFTLVGIASHSWFTARGGDGGIGLLGIERCRGLVCETMNWFDIKRAPGEIQMFATVGLLAAVTAIGFLIHAGVVLLRSEPHRVKHVALNVSLGLAIFGSLSFALRIGFGEMSRGLSISWAGFVGIGGVIAAALIVQTWVRPLSRVSR